MVPILAICSALSHAVATVLIKMGLKNSDPFSAAFISLIACFTGALILLLLSLPFSQFDATCILYFAVAGITGPWIGRLLFFIGVHRVGSSIASPLQSTKPIFSAVAAMLILGEALTLPIISGTVIMVLGLAIISSDQEGGQQGRVWSKKDLLFPLTSGLSYGIGHVFRKMGLNTYPSPVMGLAVQNAAALALFALSAGVRRNRPARIGKDHKRPWLLFFFSGCFTLMGQLTLLLALEHGTVVIVSPLSAINPLFVFILVSLFLRRTERVTWKLFVGAMLIIAAATVLVLWRTSA
jgi:drug/metabolite transporter, DME family